MSRGRLLLGLMLLALIYVALSQTESDVSVPDEPTNIEDAGNLTIPDGEYRDAAAAEAGENAEDGASGGDTSDRGASDPDANDDSEATAATDAQEPTDAELDPLSDAGGSASGVSLSEDEGI